MEAEWPRANAEAVIQAVGEAAAVRGAQMVERYRRFVRLWRSRDQLFAGNKSEDGALSGEPRWTRAAKQLLSS